MKKSFALTIVSLALALSAQAIRPIHKAFPVKQSDGTTVMLYKNGDGHLAFYTTEDHQVVVRNADGTLCYAKLVGTDLVATDVVVHDITSRTADEIAFVQSNTLKPTDQALAKLASARPRLAGAQKVGGSSTSDGLGKYGTSATGPIPTIGNIKIPVIMVEYTDTKFQPEMTIEKLDKMLNAEGYAEDNKWEKGSVRDYFKAQSRGMFTPEFVVLDKVQLSQGYAYYGKNSGGAHGTGDVNALAMVKEAVSLAVANGANFDQFKVNGKIPNVVVYYAGCGEATGGDDNTIWPHELDLPLSYGNMSGHIFSSYFVGNELYGTTEQYLPMGIGVLVHEFGHAMGLPDFYDPTYSYQGDSAFGYWSVMDRGAYVDYAYAPIGYNAYERSFMGWLDIKEVPESGLVTLANPNSAEGDMAVMFRNPKNTMEYFIFENRQPGTWYPEDSGSGVLLTRISYSPSAWMYNSVNTNQTKKRAMVVPADGALLSDDQGSEYTLFGNGVNYKTEYRYLDGGTENDRPVYGIMKQPDGSIVISFKDQNAKPEPIADGGVYEKITDVSQLNTDDVVVFANEAAGVATADGKKTLFTAVYTKFEDGKLYGNSMVQEFKLTKNTSDWYIRYNTTGHKYLCATSSGVGSTTKIDKNVFASINIEGGDATIQFTKTRYDNNNFAFSPTGLFFSTNTGMQGDFQIYRLIQGSNGISNAIVDEKPADNRMFNLAGQQVGDDYKGIVIQNGKKFMKK